MKKKARQKKSINEPRKMLGETLKGRSSPFLVTELYYRQP